MSRAKPRGSHGAALFEWTGDGGDVQPGEVVDNQLTQPCDICGAAAGEQCTRPSRRGRARRRTPHPSRGQLPPGVST